MAITKQDIFNAATAIAARGLKPTLNDIRKELDSWDFALISDAMIEWRTIQKAAVLSISASVKEPVPDSISGRLNELASDVWEIALQLAHERLQCERESLEQTKSEMELAKLEFAELADSLNTDLEMAQNFIQQQTEAASAAQAEIDKLHREISIFNDSLVKVNHDAQLANAALTEAHGRVEQLTAMLESEKSERMHASKKLEQSLVTIAEINASATELAGDLSVITGRATAAEAKSNQTDQVLNDVTKKLDKSVIETQLWQNKATLADTQLVSLKEQLSELKAEAKHSIEDAAELRGKLIAAQERIFALESLA